MELFAWGGNPFVDNGIAAMLAHCGKRAPSELNSDDIELMRERVLEVFLTEAWLKAMQNIFPNGAWTNPAFSKRRPEVATQLVNFLASKVEPLQASGTCICCGRRESMHPTKEELKALPVDLALSKVYVPLIGGVLNFFPGAIKGAEICANCVWAIHCAPLSFFTANFNEKRFIALHSTSPKVLVAWARKADENISRNLASGVWNEGYKRINVFFEMISKIISETDFSRDDRFVSVRFYHFDNYNQPKAEPLKIYDFPAPVFFFVSWAERDFSQEWRRLVRRNYYDFGKKIQGALPEAKDEAENDERRRLKPNFVLEKLLRGEPIIRNFFNRRRRVAHVSWEFVAFYLKEVLFREENTMPEARIETIKRVADELGEGIRLKKSRLRDLEAVANYAELRIRLRQMIKERIKNGADEPLFSLDEYIEHLFPQGALGWRETHDLILFRLYETLHDFLRPEDVLENEEALAEAVPPDPNDAQAPKETKEADEN
jgi:CRISPR-associated protein Cst1